MSIHSVLIVDDCEMDQYIAKHMISTFDPNIEIWQAYDGEEALEVLDTAPRKPNLILLDINMPRMNGHEFLDEYESLGGEKSQVIMLTSSDLDSDREQSLNH